MRDLTPEQREIVQSASAALKADEQIAAAWLAGSLGRGAGDTFSDVDLLVLAADGPASEVGRRYVQRTRQIAPPVLINELFGGRVISVVTEDWQRFDLAFIEVGELGRYNSAHLVELFNKGLDRPPTKEDPPYRSPPEAVLRLAREFLRILGLSAVAVGRHEWVLALSGADILRRLTIDLMLEENGVGPIERGGALRRRSLLTAEQVGALEALTPITADLDGVMTSHRELAAVFLPRARALAQGVGAEWPSQFEEATKRHLLRRLGLEIG